MRGRVAEIETLAARAWPAARVEVLDGWHLRFADGVTRRANSVWAGAHPGRVPTRDKIAHAEEQYRAQDLPPRFQISPASRPADLDGVLDDRGYRIEAETGVHTADLPLRLPGGDVTVTLGHELQPGWAKTWWGLDRRGELPPAALDILAGFPGSAAYASALADDEVVAVGRATVERDWVGIFALATRADHRRRGLGRAVLASLTGWAATLGARRAFLQVDAGNAPALGLFAAAGFTEAYRYHYRTARGTG